MKLPVKLQRKMASNKKMKGKFVCIGEINQVVPAFFMLSAWFGLADELLK